MSLLNAEFDEHVNLRDRMNPKNPIQHAAHNIAVSWGLDAAILENWWSEEERGTHEQVGPGPGSPVEMLADKEIRYHWLGCLLDKRREQW